MNLVQFQEDLGSGCLTLVPEAGDTYYDSARGLTARQSFYVYPDESIVSVTSVDGGYSIQKLQGENEAIFKHLYPNYF